jgi:hypothetical protein
MPYQSVCLVLQFFIILMWLSVKIDVYLVEMWRDMFAFKGVLKLGRENWHTSFDDKAIHFLEITIDTWRKAVET